MLFLCCKRNAFGLSQKAFLFCPCADRDFIKEDTGFINKGGVFFLHPDWGAAAADIARQPQQLLHVRHFHLLIFGNTQQICRYEC